jgi:hypothetical protein
MIEVAVAAAIIAGGIVLYRKGAREDAEHGAQGAVILLIVGAIVAIHGLGLLEYRPSQAEMEAYQEQGR